MLRPRKQSMVVIDLFCGVGGLSLGFEQAGFDVTVAIDSSALNASTYEINFPKCLTIVADLRGMKPEKLRRLSQVNDQVVDLIIGGPPCQGFSFGGTWSEGDERNDLLLDFARLVASIGPKYFVMENVKGLLSTRAQPYLKLFLQRMRRAGYEVAWPLRALNACDFGVPQRRQRVFILGAKVGLAVPEYPEATTGTPNSRPSVWDAIGDLNEIAPSSRVQMSDSFYGRLGKPSTYARLMRGIERDSKDHSKFRATNGHGLSGCLSSQHSKPISQRFAATSPGSFEPISRYFRLPKRGLAPTIRAGTGPAHGSFTAPRPIHPVHPRCITVREAARLHSYPDWFQFHPTRWHGFQQIGNSVPPLLGRAIAMSVKKAMARSR